MKPMRPNGAPSVQSLHPAPGVSWSAWSDSKLGAECRMVKQVAGKVMEYLECSS